MQSVITPIKKQEKSPDSQLNGSQKQVLPKKRFTVAALFNKRKTDAASPLKQKDFITTPVKRKTLMDKEVIEESIESKK